MLKFQGDASVPPGMVRPNSGRTDEPSAPKHLDASGDVRDVILKDGVRDGDDKGIPVADVRDFQYLVGTRNHISFSSIMKTD